MVLIPGIDAIPVCPRCGQPATRVNLNNSQPPSLPPDGGVYAACARDAVYWLIASAPQFWAGQKLSGPSSVRSYELLRIP